MYSLAAELKLTREAVPREYVRKDFSTRLAQTMGEVQQEREGVSLAVPQRTHCGGRLQTLAQLIQQRIAVDTPISKDRHKINVSIKPRQ